jgi:hypothetical protein
MNPRTKSAIFHPNNEIDKVTFITTMYRDDFIDFMDALRKKGDPDSIGAQIAAIFIGKIGEVADDLRNGIDLPLSKDASYDTDFKLYRAKTTRND